MKALQALLAIFLFTLLFSQAFAAISITPSIRQVNMARSDTIGVQFLLRNTGDSRQCIGLDADSHSGYFETSMVSDTLCLSQNSSENFTVTVRTINAPRGDYTVRIHAAAGGVHADANISVNVGEEPDIELVVYPSDICVGREESINVEVRNNSGEFKHVSLQAENEMLLPYFAPRQIELSDSQERDVKLHISPSPYSAKGRQEVSLYAITGNEITKKRITLNIVDCGSYQDQQLPFTVSIAGFCQEVRKGATERIAFRASNLAESEQLLNFSVSGDMPAHPEAPSGIVEAGSDRAFYISVAVPPDARGGDYNFSLRVSGDSRTAEKRFCLRPQSSHSALVLVLNNNQDIEQAKSAVFTVAVRNTGDYNENFTARIENSNPKITATLSHSSFALRPYALKEAYVDVMAAPDAQPGQYDINFIADSSGLRASQMISFKVVRENHSAPQATGLEIASYPTQLDIDENTGKTIIVSLLNNSASQISGVSARITGLPSGISAASKSGIELMPGAAQQARIDVFAEKGTNGAYPVAIAAENADYSAEKEMRIIVSKAGASTGAPATAAGGGWGNLAGFFALGSGAVIAVIFLAVLFLAIALIAKIFRAAASRQYPAESEIWMRRE